MFNMIKFYNQKLNNYQIPLHEVKRQLLQLLSTDDYLVCFCDEKIFSISKICNDTITLTDVKNFLNTEIPVDSLARGIRLGIFVLKQK